MKRRTERINSIIQQEISDLLREQINDPRLTTFISITKVSTSPDLKHAKVFISTLGDKVNKDEILQGFTAASGFLRRQLANSLELKHTPELSFHLDDSIERGAQVLNIIDQVASKDTENEDEH
ncbi:MAG: ribosome-binding factor A [Chloroflexi bacterium RBG_19FT_COMBO_48_23]|nr:MAG: ribosome-binding factor A [Chloroflexi bacterium RBG_19FT_COMBO_48_23]